MAAYISVQVLPAPILASAILGFIFSRSARFALVSGLALRACAICLIAQSGLGQFELIHQSYQKIFKMVLSTGGGICKGACICS